MQTLTVTTIPAPLTRCYSLTTRGEAVVAMIRLRRRWPTMNAVERRTAVMEIHAQLEQMGAEDCAWVEPMLAELAA